MGKTVKFKKNPRTLQVWEDLDAYREFCRDFGYIFRENDLYNMRTYPFQQFNKFRNGKNCKDQWAVDLKRLYSVGNQHKKGKKPRRH